jgi:hypothetical protein
MRPSPTFPAGASWAGCSARPAPARGAVIGGAPLGRARRPACPPAALAAAALGLLPVPHPAALRWRLILCGLPLGEHQGRTRPRANDRPTRRHPAPRAQPVGRIRSSMELGAVRSRSRSSTTATTWPGFSCPHTASAEASE